jgi:hypothetical protein
VQPFGNQLTGYPAPYGAIVIIIKAAEELGNTLSGDIQFASGL